MTKTDKWLGWAVRLQALAQNGLAYTTNAFDKERFEEIRQIAAEMYHANLTNNDRLYDSRNDRQQIKQTKINAHHLIQSFSPEDNLTPEEINRIGYETIKELTGGHFRFIATTHTDGSHIFLLG